MSQNQLACAIPYNNDLRLNPYQLRVVEWMEKHRGLIAAFETGTGKTLTAVAVMNCFMKKYPGKPVIVVAPLSLIANFKKEMVKFGIEPESPEIKKVFQALTYETFNKRFLDSVDEKGNFEPVCVDGLLIVDEAHKLRTELKSKKVDEKKIETTEKCEKCNSTKLSFSKDPKNDKITLTSCLECGFSKKIELDPAKIKLQNNQEYDGIQTLALLHCAHKANKVLLLTATPVYNSVYDINNLIAALQGRLQPFNKGYFEKKIDDERFFKDLFKCKISFHSREEDGSYPRRVERTEYFVMDQDYYELYFKIQTEQVEKSLIKQFGNPQYYKKFLQALRQSVNAIDREKSPKIEWITKELIKNHNNRVKSLVYSSFKDSGIVLIQNNMQKNSIPYGVVSGNVTAKNRENMVKNFNKGLTNILFVTKAGGEGLDLKETEKVYILESGWNKQGDEQVIGRAIRRNSHQNLPPNRQVVEVIRLQMKKPVKIKGDDEMPLSVDENLYNFGYVTKQPKLDAFINRLRKVSIEQLNECSKITDEELIDDTDDLYASARKSVFMVPLSEIIKKRDVMKHNAEIVKEKQREKAAKARILNHDVEKLNEQFRNLNLEERIDSVYNELIKKHPDLKDDPDSPEELAQGHRKVQKLLSNLIARKKLFSTKIYRNVRERKIIEDFQKQREEKRKQEREKVTAEFNKEEEQLNQGDKKLTRQLRTRINQQLEQLVLSEDGVTLESSSKDLADRLFETDKELKEQELEMFEPVYEYVKRWRNKVGQLLRVQKETRRKEEEYTRAKERENIKKREEEDRLNRLKRDKQKRKKLSKQDEEEEEKKSVKSIKKITQVPRKKKTDIFSQEFLEEMRKKIQSVEKEESDDEEDEEPMRKVRVESDEEDEEPMRRVRVESDEEDEEPMRKVRVESEEEDEEPMRKVRVESDEEEEPMRRVRVESDEESDEEPMRRVRVESDEEEEEEDISITRPSDSDDSEDESDDEYKKDMTADEYQEMRNEIWGRKYRAEKGLRKKIAKEWGEKYEDVEEDVDVDPKKRKIRIGMCKVDDVVTFMKFLFHFYIVYPEQTQEWVFDQIRALPEFAGCSDEQFEFVKGAAGNEMSEVWESEEISTLFEKALRAMFRYWREEKMVDVYDRIRNLTTFTEVLNPILSDSIIEDEDKMNALYTVMQDDIMYCYILYDYLNVMLKNPDAMNNEDDEIFEEIADELPYYRDAEEETYSLINDLNNFFNSDNSKTLKRADFKRVMSFLHLATENNTVDDMMDVLTSLFRNMDESDMRKEVEVYFEEYNESQKEDCEYDEYVIAGGAFYIRFTQGLDSFYTDNFKEQLSEFFPVFEACTQSQITRAIELAKETTEISSIKEFLNKQDATIAILNNSHLFGDIKTIDLLFEIIEKIFVRMNPKDLYKILTIVNDNLSLGINEEFEIMLNHKQLLSENPNHRYDRFLEKIFSEKVTESAYKVENNITYFSRDTEPSVSYIRTDVAGMYSILQAQSIIKPSVPCIFSFNPSVQEMRLTKEYSFLSDWIRFSDLPEEYISLYKNFGGVLMISLYDSKKFYNFQDVLDSIFVSKSKTMEYTFDLFGGQITFNIAEVLLLPTSWVPVVGELITPNCSDEDDVSITSIKRVVQSELFNDDGGIKSEFENNISFSKGSSMLSENLNFYENLKSLDKKSSNLLCKLQENTVPSLYTSFCIEHIPTAYFKVLVETILFNKNTPYNLSQVSQGIYKRLSSYFFKGQCNLENSHRIISALLSNDYMNKSELIKTQGLLLNLVEQVTSNKRCELNGRYPATLSQISAIKELGGLENVKKLIKDKFRDIREDELNRVLQLNDDLEIYTSMKGIHNKIKKVDEPQEKSDYYRSRARLNELKDFINFINKKYNNAKNKGDFVYLDYGGGEGGITKAISKALYLKKQNTYSLDVEDWYGNVLVKPYQEDVTYRTVKPFVSLPFKDDSVDVITCLQVLHHVHDIEYYLTELVRILKPNGYLVLREHDCNSELVRRLIDVEHMLFECVLNKDTKGNGRYLFEYKDSDGYKPISEWISILGKKGLIVDEQFSSIYQSVKSETRYVYRIFKKLEKEKKSEEVMKVKLSVEEDEEKTDEELEAEFDEYLRKSME